jgi:murein tripeptide amidase MpaA
VQVTGKIDSGAIEVVDLSQPGRAILRLKPDVNPNFRQWFHFRLSAAKGETVALTIRDVGEYNQMKVKEGLVGHPTLWADYQVYATWDRETWFNLSTRFDGSDLDFTVTMERDAVYFATYPAYTLDRHHTVLAGWLAHPRTRHAVLCTTPDGHDIDLMTVGEPGRDKRVAWITARQHPSETQGPWCLEGLVGRLLDPADPVAARLLDTAVFHIVPNLNPDGTQRGHTRTNANGVNLNREWDKATEAVSPEVYWTLEAMKAHGCDFMLDVHAWGGDKPFCIGPWHIPSERPDQVRRWNAYMQALAAKTPAFELGQPYPGGGPAPGQADLGMSWNGVGEAFGATAILYELIYKRNLADGSTVPWSIEDCRRFGRDSLEPILAALTA